MSLLLGYDVGSSSVKATLMDSETSQVLASAVSPPKELEIIAEQPGFAEQHPDTWWQNIKQATHQTRAETNFNPADIKAIGISYQMHGLVAVDRDKQVLRPAIIWCDSRSVEIGSRAQADIGEKCLEHLLNLPGNFTASKLKWVMDNEPAIYEKIHKIMLPGDYVVMKMTGAMTTTQAGLSEAILWDFKQACPAQFVMDYFGFSEELLCPIVPSFGDQGQLSKAGLTNRHDV